MPLCTVTLVSRTHDDINKPIIPPTSNSVERSAASWGLSLECDPLLK